MLTSFKTCKNICIVNPKPDKRKIKSVIFMGKFYSKYNCQKAI